MKTLSQFTKIFLLTSTVFLSITAIAAKKASEVPPVSKETREKMALLHTKMADCLRTDKPIRDCRKEMMEGCRTATGGEGCMMFGREGPMGRHRGRESIEDSTEKGEDKED
jgi:hypothetical protein